MISIRRNIFETNSSSSHSLSISHNYITVDDLVVEDDDVHTECGEFGWGVEEYLNTSTKLSYLITVVAESTIGTTWWDGDTFEDFMIKDLYETDEFQEIKEVVCSHEHCSDLIVDSLRGYIDHQSKPISMRSFLADYGLSIEEFLYGNVKLIIDNDNH